MFFVTYLRRELRRRMRQAIFIALGLAIGIGLVITVMGASAGVKTAQGKVLRALYGIGTDITVTTKPKPPSGRPTTGQASNATGPGGGPGHATVCLNGKCYTSGTIDTLVSGDHGALSAATATKIAKLHHVSAAAAGLLLTDNRIVLPTTSSSQLQPPTSTSVDGTDVAHPRLGPLSNASLTSGRTFTTADADANVAVVDANYATAHKLKVGSVITIASKKFTIVGIVTQPQASSPPEVYIPLTRAQALATDPATGKSMKNEINMVYVSAASAADISAVQKEIQHLLPQATVTSSSDLASEITGSAASAAKLAGALGKWLAVLVLIAAFAVASLLTMAAVARAGPGGGPVSGGAGPLSGASHATIAVPMSASVTLGAIVLAVLLAVAGGLLAGSFGGWRAARLRPAAALARVA